MVGPYGCFYALGVPFRGCLYDKSPTFLELILGPLDSRARLGCSEGLVSRPITALLGLSIGAIWVSQLSIQACAAVKLRTLYRGGIMGLTRVCLRIRVLLAYQYLCSYQKGGNFRLRLDVKSCSQATST